MPEAVEITLAPKPEYVGAVRHVLGALGRIAEFFPDSVEDLKLAVSESVTNAVTRAGAAGGVDPVRIEATHDEGWVHVEVRDAGERFDPGRYDDDPNDPSSQEFSFEQGLSLPVVRGLVEDLEMSPGADRGMTVRFTVRDDGEASTAAGSDPSG